MYIKTTKNIITDTISTYNNLKVTIPFKLVTEKPIGNITIDKINLNKPLYKINSPQNNVEKNITILKESNYPELLVLAAHSGTNFNSYFKNLDNLKINDEVNIDYYDSHNTYIVDNIDIQKKNGYININKKDNNYLILTTCYPKDDKYQLIVSCIKKES